MQLRERLTRDCKQEVVEEMVCMSNTRGGMIVIGINDKTGVVNPLSFKELQDTNEMLTSMASNNVVPGISLVTENVEMSVKNAGDKKRVTDNDEIAMMMAEGGSFRPDMMAVADSGMKDLDEEITPAALYGCGYWNHACTGVGEWNGDGK